jgi:hypothetical protein
MSATTAPARPAQSPKTSLTQRKNVVRDGSKDTFGLRDESAIKYFVNELRDQLKRISA